MVLTEEEEEKERVWRLKRFCSCGSLIAWRNHERSLKLWSVSDAIFGEENEKSKVGK